MRLPILAALLLASACAAQGPVAGVISTPQVDLAYEVYGAPGLGTPVSLSTAAPASRTPTCCRMTSGSASPAIADRLL